MVRTYKWMVAGMLTLSVGMSVLGIAAFAADLDKATRVMETLETPAQAAEVLHGGAKFMAFPREQQSLAEALQIEDELGPQVPGALLSGLGLASLTVRRKEEKI